MTIKDTSREIKKLSAWWWKIGIDDNEIHEPANIAWNSANRGKCWYFREIEHKSLDLRLNFVLEKSE